MMEDMEGLVEVFDRALEAAAKKAKDSGYKEGKSASRQSEAEGNKKTPTKGEGVKPVEVFSEGSTAVKLSPRDADKNYVAIKKQLVANRDRLSEMRPAANISVKGSDIPKGKTNILDWVMGKLSSWKNGVDVPEFGIVELSKKHINDGLDYLNTPAEYAAFLAVPRVLKRGIKIDEHKGHGGNQNKDSYTFAAPVIINGVLGHMAVVVNYTTKNRYHVHRIIMPDGSAFIFKEKTEPTPDARHSEENLLRPIGSDAITIPQPEPKRKYSLRDSAGNELSAEQQEYFKDSKARDEAGNLQVVYHGARDTGRTVFTRNVTYFTDDESMAESYSPNGGRYTGYVNITKPLEIDAKGSKWSAIPVSPEMEEMLRDAGASTFTENGVLCTTTGDIAAAIEEMVDEGEADYDGIIIRNVDDTGSYHKGKDKHIANDYIIFNSNQFKNMDNLNPTRDKDIRYSQRDTSDGLTREEARELGKAYTRLKAEAAYNKAKWEYWKNQTKRSKSKSVRREDVEKLGRKENKPVLLTNGFKKYRIIKKTCLGQRFARNGMKGGLLICSLPLQLWQRWPSRVV